MYTALYFFFCIHHSVFTTKNLVSIHHHTVGSLTHFTLPTTPSPLVTTATLFSVSMCLFLFGSIYSFILLFIFKIFHIWVKSCGICLFPSDLLHLATHSLDSPLLLQMTRRFYFSCVSSIPLCIYTASLSTHPSMSTQVVSVSWL